MPIGNNNLDLIFRIKAEADTSGAEQTTKAVKRTVDEIKTEIASLRGSLKGIDDVGDRLQVHKKLAELNTELKNTEKATTESAVSLKQFGNAAAVSVGVLTTLATGAALVAKGIFDLSQNFAQLATELGEVSKKTGVSTEAISGLKLAAENNKVSFSDLSSGLNKFVTNLEKTGRGTADVETELRKTIERIVSYENPIQRAKAANDAFGDGIGTKMLPVLLSFNGRLDEAIDKAREFGLVVSQDDVRAAEEFNKSLTEVSNTLSGIAILIGKEVLPAVNALLVGSLDDLENYESVWTKLGKRIAETIVGFRILGTLSGKVLRGQYLGDFTEAENFIQRMFTDPNSIRNEFVPISAGTSANIGGKTGTYQTQKEIDKARQDQIKARKAQLAEEAKAQRERMALNRRDAAANVDILKGQLKNAAQVYDDALGEIAGVFKDTGDVDKFLEQNNKVGDIWERQAKSILPELMAAEMSLAEQRKATDTEFQKLLQDQETRTANLVSRDDKRILEAQNLIKRVTETKQRDYKKAADEELRQLSKDRELKVDQEIRSEKAKRDEEDRAKKRRQLEIDAQEEEFRKNNPSVPSLLSGGETFLEGIFGADGEGVDTAIEQMGSMGEAMTTLKGIAMDMFAGMSQALGESVAQWVLYGGSIGKALKQALAAQLAHVAALATVKALESLAWGAYHLATFNFPMAGQAFIAAGLWGALAIGTAVAGRAVAGNSFSGATSGQSSGNFDLRSSNNATGNEPRSLTEGRLNRQENRLEILLRTERGWFGTALRNDLEDGGEGSSLILNMVEGGA